MRPKMNKLSLIITVGIFMLAVVIAMPLTALAIQPDAEFLVREKQLGKQWAAEDKQVQQKLAGLEKKFGKKPNIVYILTDDIGWGELGWQGGGKHRGTPTPELDKMAHEGMRFWAAYSEPSCTPSRIAINTGRHPFRPLQQGQDDNARGHKQELAQEILAAQCFIREIADQVKNRHLEHGRQANGHRRRHKLCPVPV